MNASSNRGKPIVSELNAAPIVIVSKREDDAEAINQALRNAGVMAQCTGLVDTSELATCLLDTRPLLMFVFENDVNSERFAHCIALRDDHLRDLPILLVQARVSEENIVAAMEKGATDLVSLGNKSRLQGVAKREIMRCQQSRHLLELETSAQQLEQQLESLVKESPDALIHVQEGIITAANPAWLEMFGYDNDGDIVGTLAMDLLDEQGHEVFKGALVACGQGNWSGHELDLKLFRKDGTVLPSRLQLERAVYDDEPCIRITAERDLARDMQTPQAIVDSSAHHPLTGFYRRQRFLTEIETQLHKPSKGGIRALAYLKLDNIHKVREQLGPISSDDLLLDFAKILQEHVRKHDLYGQFGGDLFMVLLPRGTMRDVVAWAENLRVAVNDSVFEVQDKSLSISCTIGLARFRSGKEDVADLVLRAQKAYQAGTKAEGNQVQASDGDPKEDVLAEGDTEQIQLIKTALMRDNFRLVYQPVASLNNQSEQIFDVLLRLIDPDGKEVMPNLFLPTAARHGLMKNIDRWVIATAIRFCKQQTANQLFVRLSKESIHDDTLFEWISQQIKGAAIAPGRLIFEVTEKDAESNLKPVKELAQKLTSIQCCVAIEHFGLGSQPMQLLEHIPTNFIKIDGSLMEGITKDKALQARVRGYVQAAQERNISTVAERVENANTMAVLWQIGVQFIQGFYVQGPEEIVLQSESISALQPVSN